MKKKKRDEITIDEVHRDMLALFHRLIGRLEKLSLTSDDPGAINQILKTTSDFLIKLNKEKDKNDDDDLSTLLQQTINGIE